MFLNVKVAPALVDGADLSVGDVIVNPRTGSRGIVIGGSELAKYNLARMFTDRPDRRQDILVQSWVDGEPLLFAVPNKSTYEFITNIEGINITV